MDMGERVLITEVDSGRQHWATVVQCVTKTGEVEPPDIFRTAAPGRSVTTVTLELEQGW